MKKKLMLIVFVFIIIIITLGGLLYIGIRMNIKSEKGDELYVKMKELNDNQSLIGLSLEEVVELLGKPKYEYNDKKNKKRYKYYAGKIIKEPILGNTKTFDSYQMNVCFDENDKVKRTYIKLNP